MGGYMTDMIFLNSTMNMFLIQELASSVQVPIHSEWVCLVVIVLKAKIF